MVVASAGKGAAAAAAAGTSADADVALYAIAEGDQFYYEPWDTLSVSKWVKGELVVHCEDEPLSSGIRSFKTTPGSAVALLRGQEVKLVWGKRDQVRAKMTSNDEIKIYHPTGEYVFCRHYPAGKGPGTRPRELDQDPALLKEIADRDATIVELTRELETERQSVARLSAINIQNMEELSILRDAAVQDRLRLASFEDELRITEAERVQVALGQCWNRTEGIASLISKSAIWLVVSSPTNAKDGNDAMHGLRCLSQEFSNIAIACDWPGNSQTRAVDSRAWDGIKPFADAFVASDFQDEASFKALRAALYTSLWFKMYSDMVKGHILAAVSARPDLTVKCVMIEGGAISRCEAHAMTFLVEEAKKELAESGIACAGLATVRCGSSQELRSHLQGTIRLMDEIFDPKVFSVVRAELLKAEASPQSCCSEEMLARTAVAKEEGERPTLEARVLREQLRREMVRSTDLESLVHGHLAALNAELPRGEGGGLGSTMQSTMQSTAQQHTPMDLPRIFWDWQRQVSAVRLFVLEHHQKVLKDAAPGNQRVESRLDRAHKLLQRQQALLQQIEGEVLSLVRGPQRQQSELPLVSPANSASRASTPKSTMARTLSLPVLRSPKGGGVVAQH